MRANESGSRRSSGFVTSAALAVAWIACAAPLALAKEAQVAAAPPRSSGRFAVSTGFDWSTGDYGESDPTQIWYVPLNLRYEWRAWALRLTLPYIRVSGPSDVVVGADGVVVAGGAQRGREERDGVGDVIAGVQYRIDPPRPWLPFLELTAKVKLPTARESDGLGTGEFDYTLQLEAVKSIGAWTPFASVGYRFVGDPPGSDLSNTLSASAGFDWRATHDLSLGAYYSWRQTASRSLGDAHEIVPYLSWRVAPHVSIGPYLEVGLSAGAPDVGAGLQIGFRQ